MSFILITSVDDLLSNMLPLHYISYLSFYFSFGMENVNPLVVVFILGCFLQALLFLEVFLFEIEYDSMKVL